MHTFLHLHAYLAILDYFVKDTTPSTSATNAPVSSPEPKPAPAEKDE